MSKNNKEAKPERASKKKEKQPETEQQRKRKLIIKIIAAVAAFIIAIAAFGIGISKYLHKDPGFYHIEGNTVEDAMLYSKELLLTCYFDGSSTEIRTSMSEARNEYTTALSHIFRLLDPETAYEGYTNIAYLNSHIGEDTEIDPVLFDNLKRAKELTGEGFFNMFGGALYKEWNSIIVLSDAANFDPLNDPAQAERIFELAEKTADPANFSFEIVDEAKHTVRFTVSEDYLAFLEENEFSKNVLDLGFLKKAFEIEYTAKKLSEAGFIDGYLSSSDGSLTYAFTGLREGGVYLDYTLLDGAPAQACRLTMAAGSACCQLRSFPLEEAYGYYTVSADDGEHLRHPYYYPLTGEVRDELLSAMTVSYEGDIAGAALMAYGLMTAQNEAEAARMIGEAGENGMLLSFISKAEPTVIKIDKAHLGDITILEDRPFTAKSV